MFSFVLGIGLYGLTYLYPIYLAQIRGFNALMIGQTLFISGASMFLTAPLVGRLMSKVDARWMLAFGFAVVALSNWQMTYLTKDWEFWQLFLPQVLRGFGMMFAIVPITNISLGTLAPERLKNASGLFNLTRNLGGAVGLARAARSWKRSPALPRVCLARTRRTWRSNSSSCSCGSKAR
jgi:MFS transporter, DHA2 family, multidrug resistance protein